MHGEVKKGCKEREKLAGEGDGRINECAEGTLIPGTRCGDKGEGVKWDGCRARFFFSSSLDSMIFDRMCGCFRRQRFNMVLARLIEGRDQAVAHKKGKRRGRLIIIHVTVMAKCPPSLP